MNEKYNLIQNNNNFIDLIKKQGYSIIGSHGAVKTCLWLKKSLYNIDVCYKSKFYGIQSHKCIQMTPILICNQKCIFCWRAIEYEIQKPCKWDDPNDVFLESIKSQLKLISGFGGSKESDQIKYQQAKFPSNVAISLSGEPTLYPYLDELISIYNKKKFSTFVVTNGTNPEMTDKINPKQLYISLDAPTENLYNSICKPKHNNQWTKLLNSLEILNLKKYDGIKTAIRITVIKNYNFQHASKFSDLINIALPNYIEIKSYMHIGFSRFRLNRNNMVTIEELLKFATEICRCCTKYHISNISDPSKVVLLSLIFK